MSRDDDLSGCLIPLIGLVVVAYIVYIIVCVVAVIAVVALVLMSIVGLVWGILYSTINFFRSIKENLLVRSGKTAENALVSFFYIGGDWIYNLLNICRATFQYNWRAIASVEFSGGGCLVRIFKVPFYLFHALAILIGTIVYLPVLFTLFLSCFCIIWGFYTLIALEMRLLEWSILKVYGLFNLCRQCHHKLTLPIYTCPGCGVEHTHLISSTKFGPFFRRCQCGEYLPASRFFGRNDLPASCSNCHSPLAAQDAIPVSIAVLGGSSVGKSQLLMGMTALLIKRVLPGMGHQCLIPSADKIKVDKLVACFDRGEAPGITQDTAVEALCIEMKAPASAFPTRLYLYDPPGESFRGVNKISSHRYYQHLRAAVLVIDPFTLDACERAYSLAGAQLAICQRGAMPPEESLGRWLISMEKDFQGIARKSVCAVVITKVDEPSFHCITGLSAGATNETCRAFLEKYECGNLIHTLENSFKKCRFFAVSATGRNANQGNAFNPIGVDEVLQWLIKSL